MPSKSKTLRERILEVEDIGELVPLELPEWGETVYLAQPSGAAVLAWSRLLRAHDAALSRVAQPSGADFDRYEFEVAREGNVRAQVAVSLLRDAEGNKIFRQQDVPAVARKSGKALDKIFQKAVKAGLLAGSVEEETKN